MDKLLIGHVREELRKKSKNMSILQYDDDSATFSVVQFSRIVIYIYIVLLYQEFLVVYCSLQNLHR